MSLKIYERLTRQTLNWNEIPDYSFQVSQSGFAFAANNFFYENVDKATQQLTSAGIMDYLIKDCIPSTKNIIIDDHWSVLTVESLSFGFVIWLGCCGICVSAFAGELFFWNLGQQFDNFRVRFKVRKLKQAKVYPIVFKCQVALKNYPNDRNLFKKKVCVVEDLENGSELIEIITNGGVCPI